MKPDVQNLDRLLRLTFKDKEFAEDKLKSNIEDELSKIELYNQKYNNAIDRLQQNLQILEDPKKHPDVHTLDADNYEGQFSAKHLLHNYIRGEMDDQENFNIVEALGKNLLEDDKDNPNMRRILGVGRRKPWKATRIEFGPALKELLTGLDKI